MANIAPYCPPQSRFMIYTSIVFLSHVPPSLVLIHPRTHTLLPQWNHICLGWGLTVGTLHVHLHMIFTMFSSSPLPDHPQQNGPVAWRMEAGLLAPSRCDLGRHGTAGKLWTTATPGHSHSCTPRTGLRRSALRVWEVKHTCSLCVWDVVRFTDEAIIVLCGFGN